MRFSEFEMMQIEKEVGGYCRRRTNPATRDKLSIKYRTRGLSVTIYERRAAWRRPGEWTEGNAAQFRKDPDTKTWRLYCRDQHSRWHRYDLPPFPSLAPLLEEVDRDPTGIFWG